MKGSTYDSLRDAAAQGRLLVVTGAGISSGLKRDDGTYLPNWGELVQALRGRADLSRIAPEKQVLLDYLLPTAALDELHGDALIEASEILREGFKKGEFETNIVELCRERDGECSETHRAIAEITPGGIITFNYDRAHERAFDEVKVPIELIIYNQHERLRADLVRRERRTPFLLKAHGCVTDPDSLVLTSSSYREVLANNRAYRAFLQHVLIHYTVLIVGFAMRDRDFDQLLNTLEIELGRPIQQHAFIAKEPDTTAKGLAKRAEWAAITARFGVEPVYVAEYREIPEVIRSIAGKPGPLVQRLISEAQSADLNVRRGAHENIDQLGRIGRIQVKAALLDALDDAALDPDARSEILYTMRSVADGDPVVAQRLLKEIEDMIAASRSTMERWQVECIAHALLAIRRNRFLDPLERSRILAILSAPQLLDALKLLDDWAVQLGGIRRLVAYTEAACAEIASREIV